MVYGQGLVREEERRFVVSNEVPCCSIEVKSEYERFHSGYVDMSNKGIYGYDVVGVIDGSEIYVGIVYCEEVSGGVWKSYIRPSNSEKGIGRYPMDEHGHVELSSIPSRSMKVFGLVSDN